MKIIKMQNTYINKIKQINKNGKYAVLTMGCQLNENDSEKISGMLEESGYAKTNDLSQANVIVFNTCCVRENAEDRLFGKLGEVKKYKENNGTIIAIGGCMMQEKHIVSKLKQSYPFVDIVFGPHTMQDFPKDLYNSLVENKKIEDILDIDGNIIEDMPIVRNDNIKASVSIMNGCNNFCTYCIVPYVRGRERSRNPQDIYNEVLDLAKKGYKEITLLGQNVNSYLVSERKKLMEQSSTNFENQQENNGKQDENNQPKQQSEFLNLKVRKDNGEEAEVNSFAKLLRLINTIDGIERIRFISPHPKDFTDDVIEAIKDCDKVCNLIHLPLQSGSSNILKAMNRKYTKEQYLNLVEKIKAKIPNVQFSTDIIVGFPEETEKDFEDTLDVVKKVGYEQIFMFIYSRRIGTVADKMQNQIDEKVKHERFNRLKSLAEEIIEKGNKKYIGTVQKVLVEGKSKTNDKIYTGRTETNKVVNFEGNDDLIGKVIPLNIVSEHMWYLKGKYEN